MTVLSWTGLIINGLVAFILPMVLAYRVLENRQKKEQMKSMQRLSGESLSYNHSYDALSSVTHVNIQDCEGAGESNYKQNGKQNPPASQYQGVEMTALGEGATRKRGLDISNNSNNGSSNSSNGHSHGSSNGVVLGSEEQQHSGYGEEQEEEEGEVINSVQALPAWLEPVRKYLVLCIIWFFTLIISFTIFMDVYTGAAPG